MFVTGSAGIGKSALVDSFLRDVGADEGGSLALGRGECGDGDFHPILRAVEHLCRSRRDDMAAVLRRYAPEWITRLNVRFKPAEENSPSKIHRDTHVRKEIHRDTHVRKRGSSRRHPWSSR